MKPFLLSLSYGVLFASVVHANTPSTSEPKPERVSLLSCKLGPDCNEDNVECKDYESWYILRYYPATDRYAFFSALGGSERDVSFQEFGTFLVFDWYEPPLEDAHAGFDRSYYGDGVGRFIINERGRISMSHAFDVTTIGENNFFSSETSGICEEIK